MSTRADFLDRLLVRQQVTAGAIEPRLPSLFEAGQGPAPAAMPAGPEPEDSAGPPKAARAHRHAAAPAAEINQPTNPPKPAIPELRPQRTNAAAPAQATAQPLTAPSLTSMVPRYAKVRPPEESVAAGTGPVSNPVATETMSKRPSLSPLPAAVTPFRTDGTLPAGVLNAKPALERLLPPKENPSPAPAPHRSMRDAAGDTGGATQQPPDVHISIGRFEVRAEAAPRAPGREPARRPAAMSLDDYFKRNGDRP